MLELAPEGVRGGPPRRPGDSVATGWREPMFSGDQGPIRALAALGGLGFVLGALMVLGWLLGQYLDRRFGTGPWLSLVGSLVGMGAGFFEIYTVVTRAEREDARRKGRGR
jgi:ATP synthase protein I